MNDDELCVALWGFYVSLQKVQEHLSNQSSYVSCMGHVYYMKE